MTQLIFMSNVLSDQEVSVEAKVQAMKKSRKPQNVVEFRAFLGLVNFSAKFIPNRVTISKTAIISFKYQFALNVILWSWSWMFITVI